LRSHSVEEESNPTIEVTSAPHVLKVFVVLRLTFLEVGTDIQERLGEHSLLHEEEADEEAAKPAVAIQERVDRLELVMNQSAADEHGKARTLLVEELLPIGEGIHHLLWWRRHEGRILDRCSALTDPVLRPAELAGRLVGTGNAFHHPLVELTDEPET
jgi:hypothetical protein